jgi:hypothetical protein
MRMARTLVSTPMVRLPSLSTCRAICTTCCCVEYDCGSGVQRTCECACVCVLACVCVCVCVWLCVCVAVRACVSGRGGSGRAKATRKLDPPAAAPV